MSPVISVIIPFYNAEKYILESVESILNQTFTDFELILINDLSSDKSLYILETISDSRVKIINKKTNTGISDCLNIGISIAEGKYIARMDADDIAQKIDLKNKLIFS